MVKLYIKSNYDGRIHEYGTNPHDSLILQPDGSLHYYNLQCGEGSEYASEKGGFSFCAPDGSDPREDEDIAKYGAEPYIDIGGEYYSERLQ